VAAAVGVLVLVNKHARQPAWAKLGDKSPTDRQQLPLRNRGHDIVAPRSPRLASSDPWLPLPLPLSTLPSAPPSAPSPILARPGLA
jgi:hypothetical protein